MGLSIHIHAHAPASFSGEKVHALVARWHGVAEAFAVAGRVERVLEISDDAGDLEQFATRWLSHPHPAEPDTITGVAAPPLEGSIFLVLPGEGCEPLVLGLCRYPAAAETGDDEPNPPAGNADGWHLLSSCKTQYASRLGWEHFRRCHLAVVDLALAGQSIGMDVHIEDEGGYWPARHEAILRASLERLNRLTAGLAGALKDAADAGDGCVASVQAPILAHPDFERLEAEAHTALTRKNSPMPCRQSAKSPHEKARR